MENVVCFDGRVLCWWIEIIHVILQVVTRLQWYVQDGDMVGFLIW